jgi:hypothetical protein
MAEKVAVGRTSPSPVSVASPVWTPTLSPRTTKACARPSASVRAVDGVTSPPSPAVVRVNSTVAPSTGAPAPSITSTTTGAVSGSPTDPCWPSPSTTRIASTGALPGRTRSVPQPAVRQPTASQPAKRPGDQSSNPRNPVSRRPRDTFQLCCVGLNSTTR